ncbi:HAD-IA family hydrolase [Limnohabitans parvus]|uniref:HAD family hydrolase n=1 Tax=Limnohabitans parvus II-B4 TaxID=1293052 RepID=A0A315EE49_9BURK|nr:HAD-IA family hydrolase [Limnohabitans parvus]PUE55148.1 HAD family hydrolase [Limnohabitans parvus II-B4]
MSAASAKALVLDFGGVISRTLFETHDLSEAALGLPPGTLTWRGPFDPETDALWQAMQADHITEREYWMARTRSVGDLVGEEWNDMQTFVQRARGADVEAVIRPEAVTAVHQAKAAGCKLAVLSNELDLFYGASFRERLPLLQLFDVIIDATYTGILKPDRRAYEMCTEALGVAPADCVFVDDQSRNVLGAMRLGWQTVQFDVTHPADSYQRALKLLGL